MKFDFFNSVEQRFRRSEVQFLMGTQNFFFVPRCWKNKNHLSLKITLFICALITKGNVTFSLKKDLKLILFQLYFIITLYESLLVFFFWSRNEWSNVGLLVSKNIPQLFPKTYWGKKFLQCSKCCTWTIWIIISTLKISLCLSDITSAAHAVQIHSIMRKFAFNPLLKLIEGNLHCTSKVAGFCHHIGIVKEHQLFWPSIAGKVISRIWQETINPNIQ